MFRGLIRGLVDHMTDFVFSEMKNLVWGESEDSLLIDECVCVWISCQVLSPVLTPLTFLILHGFPHLRSCRGCDWVGGTVSRATTHNPSCLQFKPWNSHLNPPLYPAAVYIAVTTIIAYIQLRVIRLWLFFPVILWSTGAQSVQHWCCCCDSVNLLFAMTALQKPWRNKWINQCLSTSGGFAGCQQRRFPQSFLLLKPIAWDCTTFVVSLSVT